MILATRGRGTGADVGQYRHASGLMDETYMEAISAMLAKTSKYPIQTIK